MVLGISNCHCRSHLAGPCLWCWCCKETHVAITAPELQLPQRVHDDPGDGDVPSSAEGGLMVKPRQIRCWGALWWWREPAWRQRLWRGHRRTDVVPKSCWLVHEKGGPCSFHAIPKSRDIWRSVGWKLQPRQLVTFWPPRLHPPGFARKVVLAPLHRSHRYLSDAEAVPTGTTRGISFCGFSVPRFASTMAPLAISRHDRKPWNLWHFWSSGPIGAWVWTPRAVNDMTLSGQIFPAPVAPCCAVWPSQPQPLAIHFKGRGLEAWAKLLGWGIGWIPNTLSGRANTWPSWSMHFLFSRCVCMYSMHNHIQ